MTLATLATAYALAGLMADGRPTPSYGGPHPRVLAAAAADLDAGRVHLGDRVCVCFPGGDRHTYTVRDRCPDPAEVPVGGCAAGHVDLHVRDRARAVQFGRQPVLVTTGACR